jgi:hypothetical protein
MTVNVPDILLPCPYANLSDIVEIGGRGWRGVKVAYEEFGLKPGGDIRPFTDVNV